MPHAYLFALWLSLAVFILSLSALLVVQRAKKKQRWICAIQLLQAGCILLMHLQKHRGLQMAYLSGEHNLGESAHALRDIIVQDIYRVSSLDGWVAEHQDWQALTRHWASLSVTCEALSIEVSFSQHSRLIGSLMALLASVASHYGLDEHVRYTGVKVAWREFLDIGERIGQCRALGVRILVTGASGEESKKMRKRIKVNLDALLANVNSAQCLRQLNQQQKEQLELFLAFVRSQILEQRAVVSTREYFDMASNAMALVYEQFEFEMMRLHRRIG